jgi:hypothetical protein
LALIVYHVYYPTPFLSSNYEIMAAPRKTHKELDDEIEEEGTDEEREELLGEEQV